MFYPFIIPEITERSQFHPPNDAGYVVGVCSHDGQLIVACQKIVFVLTSLGLVPIEFIENPKESRNDQESTNAG